jgi:hypothetical protein
MGKKEPFICANNGCNFSSKNKMLLEGHQKLRCIFAKKRIKSKKNPRTSTKLQVDLSGV